MVWRSNIKVLEMKAKTLPLVISMTLHVVVLLVFAIANHEREKVFTVDLAFYDRNEPELAVAQKNRRLLRSARNDKLSNVKALKSLRGDLAPKQSHLVKETDHQTISEKPLEKTMDLNATNEADGNGKAAISVRSDSVSDVKMHGSYIDGDGKTENDLSEKSGVLSVSKGSPVNAVETVFGSMNGPFFLKMIRPDYPRLARRLGKEGKVVLRLFIDEHGRLLNVEIVEKAGYGFDEAAIEAVKTSAFRPAKLNGYPVACKALLPVRFKLE